MKPYPLISCVCVTRGNPQLLEGTVACFKAQTYPNRELVILYESGRSDTCTFLSAYTSHTDIRLLEVNAEEQYTLGALRNLAIRAATGSYVCQWDDDDWYHKDRLLVQYEVLEMNRMPACVLGNWLLFDQRTGLAYRSHSRLWEGSILCERGLLLETPYANIRRGEDTPVIGKLFATGKLHTLSHMPQLYVYSYHGNNTWPYAHWEQIFRHSTPLSPTASREVGRAVRHEVPTATASLQLDSFL